MGCIARLGCLIVLAVLAGVGWLTRDRWLPRVRNRIHHTTAPAPRAARSTWEPLSPAGAEHTRAALTKLGQPKGPVFATLSGADVASYVFMALAKDLPPSTDSIQATVIGDRVSMRASMKPADLGGTAALGPLAAILGDREPVELAGTLRVVRPGLAEF